MTHTAKYAEAKARVLKRFEGRDFVKGGPARFAWHVHHSILLERLNEPIENRVDWIIAEKTEHEIEVRLEWLRPVECDLPKLLIEASAAYDQAFAAYIQTRDAMELAWAEREAYNQAREARFQARDAREWVYCAYRQARDACAGELEEIHQRELPGCPWTGGKMVFEAIEPEGE